MNPLDRKVADGQLIAGLIFLTGLIAFIVIWRIDVGLPEDVTGLPAQLIGLVAVIIGLGLLPPLTAGWFARAVGSRLGKS
jgi:hypothetical protein